MSDVELVFFLAVVETVQLVLLALIYAVSKTKGPMDDG